MEIVLPKPGRYVIAVSGGVDSMTLLHMLQTRSELELIVAHLDHGIRPDSDKDRKLVEFTAQIYGLPFAYEQAALGENASEALARRTRYAFLTKVTLANQASAIITAHHEDDVLETAVINLLRGTNHRGLTALSNHSTLIRPLLKTTKKELMDYAKLNNISWQEDNTNSHNKYLRNYVRNNLLKRAGNHQKAKMTAIISESERISQNLNTLLVKYFLNESVINRINRYEFSLLPHNVAREILATWLRKNSIRSFDRRTLERLVIMAKVSSAGKTYPVLNGHKMLVSKTHLALTG